MTQLQNKIKEFVYAHMNVAMEEGSEYACFCSFHENFQTPSLYVNKDTGLWHCFNPSCDKRGRFTDLVKAITGESIFVSEEKNIDQLETMLENVSTSNEDEGFDKAMERITIDYQNDEELSNLNYLVDRGFHTAILEHFEIGYSEIQDRIVIPVRDEHYKVVGFIGRVTDETTVPKYKYTDKFPRRNLILNLCNAKQYDTVIVVEGSLDHIKVHQAGFPNVVSTMGSTISQNQLDLLNKYFSSIIVFADNDAAGNTMKRAIMEGCARQDMSVVSYPEGFKDPGEMNEKQIQDTIKNRVTHLEYLFNSLNEK